MRAGLTPDSAPGERLDARNGLAACPPHDAAFDTGMITVNGGLLIHVARPLAEAIRTDPITRLYYGQPPLRGNPPAPRRSTRARHQIPRLA
jgi:putative restriction endonuclease